MVRRAVLNEDPAEYNIQSLPSVHLDRTNAVKYNSLVINLTLMEVIHFRKGAPPLTLSFLGTRFKTV